MFFEHDGKTYGVKFRREGTTTFAKLFVVDESGKLSDLGVEGIAFLYHTDRFEKGKGRKVALADLMSEMNSAEYDGTDVPIVTKETREKIWTKYFETHNK
jgi:hypothetical protein